MASALGLHRRLLRDIAELQSEPYPNIAFHINDSLTEACLVLTPEGLRPLHLTMVLKNYPLRAPTVIIQTFTTHPNVFGTSICASILNDPRAYTSAYTLKSISIQLLSFFSSDSLEQGRGLHVLDLSAYKSKPPRVVGNYRCAACGFEESARLSNKRTLADYIIPTTIRRRLGSSRTSQVGSTASEAGRIKSTDASVSVNTGATDEKPGMNAQSQEHLLTSLPDEILLLIFAKLSTRDLLAVSFAIPKIHEILNSYDFIRVMELQCFCLKESFVNLKLGIGIHISPQGRERIMESEFDLLSHEGFYDHYVRQSVQGLPFEHWLPLPLSRCHWRMVRPEIHTSLQNLAEQARLSDRSDFSVLSHFLNDIVVKFSKEADKSYRYDPLSALTHASEKAVDSYFALFHLLLCLATEQSEMVEHANTITSSFLSGQTSKAACPNLGHLLVATLISSDGLTEGLTHAIINEAILRNVVWMLDPRGANMPELSYLEPSTISKYRLQKTFEASRTSYRLLMFCNLFCKAARSNPNKSVTSIRDEMFDTHGAPPRGMAEHMASEIRRIKTIDSFPPFFREMGVKVLPEKSELTSFLRRMVKESVEVGYSKAAISQGKALAVRRLVEPSVEVAEGVVEHKQKPGIGFYNFFPSHGRKGQRED
ncbi:MAG: hypothetical protein Q9217_000200 [Psora testacea]